MKKKLYLALIVVVLMTTILSTSKGVQAKIDNIPYDTYSIGLYGELVNTATAYEGTFILNAGFDSPEDIFIDQHDHVYIADTGNKRIYKYDPHTKEEADFGVGVLESPTGVYVDKDQEIYVADSKLNKVFVFNQDDELLKTYGRPDNPLFGEDANFLPRKVLVNARKNVFIVSEGGTNGIIQLDSNGDFLGYYGVNKVEISFALYVRRMIMSKEQKEKYANLKPKPTANIAIDQKGLIYTVIQNEYLTPIKKLNIEGINKLTGELIEEPYYQDIFVDKDGLIYVVTNNIESEGVISVLDRDGNLIFMFGERKPGSLRMGQFENPSGIAVDSTGDIWVLDRAAGNAQVFTRTEFADLVFSAIYYHEQSRYDISEELFEEVVRQNSMFRLAHSSLGKTYHRHERLEDALKSYRIANDKEGYSEVYWELRDQWIADHLATALLVLLIVFISYKLFKKYRDRFMWYQKLTDQLSEWKQTQIYHELSSLKNMLRHPHDVVYEIKFRQSIRIRTAAILYVVFVFLNIICDFYIRGYLFRWTAVNVVLSFEVMRWLLPLLLIGVSNHLINSLQGGEAYYRDIFIGLIYAMAPVFIFKVPIDILSNVLTYNEAFLFQLAYIIMTGWAIVNVILVLKELNNYTAGQTVINILLTLFTAVIIVTIYLVVNVLTNQLLSFIQGLFQEVFS